MQESQTSTRVFVYGEIFLCSQMEDTGEDANIDADLYCNNKDPTKMECRALNTLKSGHNIDK